VHVRGRAYHGLVLRQKEGECSMTSISPFFYVVASAGERTAGGASGQTRGEGKRRFRDDRLVRIRHIRGVPRRKKKRPQLRQGAINKRRLKHRISKRRNVSLLDVKVCQKGRRQ